MRRVLRWTLTIACGTIFLACTAAWVRSYWVRDLLFISYPSPASMSASMEHTIDSYQGNFVLSQKRVVRLLPRTIAEKRDIPGTYLHLKFRPDVRVSQDDWARFAGFGFHREVNRASETLQWSNYGVSIPYWFPTGLLALWAIRRIAQICRRRGPTLCHSCGYDLRSGHEKCPECGAVSHVAAGEVGGN